MTLAGPLAGLLPVRLAGLVGERGDVPGWPGSCASVAAAAAAAELVVMCAEEELVITAGGLGGGGKGGGNGGGKVADRVEAPPRAPAAEAAKRLAAERLAVAQLSSNKGTRALSRVARLLSLLIWMDSDAFLIRMDSDASIVCRSENAKRMSAGGTEPMRPTSITRRSCESVHSSSCET